MRSPPRIYYAAGPGDIVGTFDHWNEGRPDPGQVAHTYSGQFFDACRDLGSPGYAESSNLRPDSRQVGLIRVENRPIPRFRSPLSYHAAMLVTALRTTWHSLRFRADVAVISSGTTHWFLLIPLAILGVRVVPTLHCVLYPKHQPLKRSSRMILRLDSVFLSRFASAIMCVSRDIEQQVGELTGGRHPQVSCFMPTYHADQFEGIAPADWNSRPFRVLFAGRIERSKGVFDLLEIAERFDREGVSDIEFDLCGSGSMLEELRGRVHQAGLVDRFRCHGHCDRDTMRAMFERSHAVIVPTTSSFIEGFNKVVAESILSLRPVVTSSICPALDQVQSAAIEVPPDDVRAYGDALLALSRDEHRYEALRSACCSIRSPFFDPEHSWRRTLIRVVSDLGGRPVDEVKARNSSGIIDA